MIVKCSDCAFWIREKNNNFGQCRRKAPQPVCGSTGVFVGAHNNRAIWPYTREIDGCWEGVSISQIVPEETRDQTIIRDTKPPTLTDFNAAVEKARNE